MGSFKGLLCGYFGKPIDEKSPTRKILKDIGTILASREQHLQVLQQDACTGVLPQSKVRHLIRAPPMPVDKAK
jgi:hypothetical protein